MNKLLPKPIGILAAVFMLLTVIIMPQAAWAKVMISDGSGQGGGGSSEGDPLDSNDYSGGGGDDGVHERRVIPRGFDYIIYDIQVSSQAIMLRVDFIGDIPVFSIYFAADSGVKTEASHVR